MNEKPASFASKVTSIKIVLRQVRFRYSLELTIPISDFLLYPSHTCLSVSYSVCSCEGCEGCPFFWLDPKEPKTQDHIRSFLLKEKNQKFKAASRLFVSLCAPQTRFAQTATLRPLHFVPPLNAHQNEAGPMDN